MRTLLLKINLQHQNDGNLVISLTKGFKIHLSSTDIQRKEQFK